MKLTRPFRRSCKGSPTYTNHVSDLGRTGSSFTRTIAPTSAAGLVIASMGFAGLYSWSAGSQHGIALGALSVIMALALEGAKPLALAASLSAFQSWSLVRGTLLALLALVGVVFSLTSELSLIAGSRGDLVAKREAAIESYDYGRQRVKDARIELATLAPSRTIEEVKADITKLFAANPKAGDCRNATANATDRYICPKVADYQGEIARAKRRSELLAILDRNIDGKNTTTAVKYADPGSAVLATYLGTLGFNVSTTKLTDWLVLIPVLALEIGGALSVLLVQSVSGSGSRQTAIASQQPDIQTMPAPGPAPDTQSRAAPGNSTPHPGEKRTPRKPTKRTSGRGGKRGGGGQSGKRRLGNVVDLLKARGGQISGGQRGIARALKMSKSRVNELLHELAAAGKVRLTTSRAGTTVALAV